MTEKERVELTEVMQSRRLAGVREHSVHVASTGEAILFIDRDNDIIACEFKSLTMLEEFVGELTAALKRRRETYGGL